MAIGATSMTVTATPNTSDPNGSSTRCATTANASGLSAPNRLIHNETDLR